MKSKITTKGQVTIPIEIRRRLNLKPGHVLEFDDKAPFVKATRSFEVDDMQSVIGCARDRDPRVQSSDWLRESRGDVELPKDANAHGG